MGLMYRDDLDAALAQVASLEQELAELRAVEKPEAARIAELEKQLAAATKGARAEKKRAGKPAGRELPMGWLSIGTGVLVALSIYVWTTWIGPGVGRTSVDSMYLLESSHTVVAISGDRSQRISLVDAVTGQEKAREVGDPTSYEGATRTGLWFKDFTAGLGLHRRNATTLAVEVPQKQWSAALGGVKVEGGLNADEHAFSLLTDDGRFLLLDPDTLVTRPARDRLSGSPAERGYAGGHHHGDLRGGLTTSFHWPPKSYRRIELSTGDLPSEESAISCDKQPKGATFLSASFLCRSDRRGDAIVVDDTLLVVHRRVRGVDKGLQLSRVGCTGPAMWTIDLATTQVLAGLLDGDQVLVLTRNTGGTDDLTAYALSDGRRRWSHAY